MIRPDYEPDLFPHWSSLPIRYRDLDPLNHVNNAIFSTYYEEARIKLISEIPTFLEQMNRGFSFVLASLRIDFIRPAEFPGELLVGSGVKAIGNSSITSFQAIYETGEKQLLSVAEASGVWFNLDTQRPSRVPEIKNRDHYLINVDLFA
ncbi:MAG: thioesterase family protein [Balneolaceae bacterium]|nr:thioesterase family protein [Balneolaceae bacterium]